MQNLNNLEADIKIKFKNFKLLKQAVTHKSFSSNENYEKLEFLGDRVLGLVISKKCVPAVDPIIAISLSLIFIPQHSLYVLSYAHDPTNEGSCQLNSSVATCCPRIVNEISEKVIKLSIFILVFFY